MPLSDGGSTSSSTPPDGGWARTQLTTDVQDSLARADAATPAAATYSGVVIRCKLSGTTYTYVSGMAVTTTNRPAGSCLEFVGHIDPGALFSSDLDSWVELPVPA